MRHYGAIMRQLDGVAGMGGDPTWREEEALSTLDVITAYERAYECGGAVAVGQRDVAQEG